VTTANSSGNKVRLGGITKAGNRYLRQMLVVGAMAVIRHAERNGARRPWLVRLLARTATKLAAIALANKTARIECGRLMRTVQFGPFRSLHRDATSIRENRSTARGSRRR